LRLSDSNVEFPLIKTIKPRSRNGLTSLYINRLCRSSGFVLTCSRAYPVAAAPLIVVKCGGGGVHNAFRLRFFLGGVVPRLGTFTLRCFLGGVVVAHQEDPLHSLRRHASDFRSETRHRNTYGYYRNGCLL